MIPNGGRIGLSIPVLLMAALVTARGEPVTMDGAAISKALSGNSVEGVRDGRTWRQAFSADGGTVYREAGGEPSRGRWRVDNDRYCSAWPPGDNWSCYEMARDGDDVLFIEAGGTVWRARVIAD